MSARKAVLVVGHWAAALVQRLWLVSWQVGVLAALVWLLCRMRPRLFPGSAYWLWWIVCLKALVGLFWVTPLNLPVLPGGDSRPAAMPAAVSFRSPHAAGVAVAARSASVDDTAIVEPMSRPAGHFSGPVGEWSAKALPAVSGTPWLPGALSLFLALAWISGVIFHLGRIIRHLHRAHRLLQGARPASGAVQDLARRLARGTGIETAPCVLVAQDATGPMAIGPFRPALVIGAAMLGQLSGRDLELAIAHELAHIRRRDLWLALAPSLAGALFFFHPLLILAHREWAAACELLCDREAITSARCSGLEFGRLIIKVSAYSSAPETIAALGAASGYRALARRLIMLQDPAFVSSNPRSPDPRSRRRLIAGAVCVALLAGAAVVPWKLRRRPTGSVGSGKSAALAIVPRNPLPSHYTLQDLGTLGGLQSIATAVNDAGQVVGWSEKFDSRMGEHDHEVHPPDGVNHAFLWQNGVMRDLGALPGESDSRALAINNKGQVLGMSGSRGFLWQNGHMEALPSPRGRRVIIEGMNDQGQILGAYLTGRTDIPAPVMRPRSDFEACLWDHGKFVDLGMLPGGIWSIAFAVNNRGEVVGECDIANPRTRKRSLHTWIWRDGRLSDLGVLGDGQNMVINDRGQIGFSKELPGPGPGRASHAAVWNAGKTLERGALSSDLWISKYPIVDPNTHVVRWEPKRVRVLGPRRPDNPFASVHAIDDAGNMVGRSGFTAAVWTGGKVVPLAELLNGKRNIDLDDATGLNRRGQICGYGESQTQIRMRTDGPGWSSVSHAFLATPAPVIAGPQR